MKVIPAVDLLEGKVVRLFQGNLETAKIYDSLGDPVATAKKWERDGADALHIIDLDAALNRGNNFRLITKITEAINVPVQVGGGIRKFETAVKLLEGGINRIILGAMAFKQHDTLKRVQERFGSERIIVALDHQGDRIMVEGWKTPITLTIEEALTKFSDLQIKNFLVTSIAKDGTLTGPDFQTLSRVRQHKSNVKIIAAGGISSLNDLIILKQIGVEGVVIGKALYEDKFTLKEAISVAKGEY